MVHVIVILVVVMPVDITKGVADRDQPAASAGPACHIAGDAQRRWTWAGTIERVERRRAVPQAASIKWGSGRVSEGIEVLVIGLAIRPASPTNHIDHIPAAIGIQDRFTVIIGEPAIVIPIVVRPQLTRCPQIPGTAPVVILGTEDPVGVKVPPAARGNTVARGINRTHVPAADRRSRTLVVVAGGRIGKEDLSYR